MLNFTSICVVQFKKQKSLTKRGLNSWKGVNPFQIFQKLFLVSFFTLWNRSIYLSVYFTDKYIPFHMDFERDQRVSFHIFFWLIFFSFLTRKQNTTWNGEYLYHVSRLHNPIIISNKYFSNIYINVFWLYCIWQIIQ